MVRMSSMAAAGLLLLSACSGAGAPAPPEAAATATTTTGGGSGGGASRASFTVMTRNLYLGADIRRLAATTQPADIPAAAGAMWTVIQESDVPARVESIADEIGAAGPHLVALEEVSLYRTGAPNACVGKDVPATTVAIDFLDLLRTALARRGLDYLVAGQLENFDAQLCTQVGAESFIDVRLTDRDVILARADLPLSNPRSANFTARALFPTGGGSLAVPRGWLSVDAASPLGSLRFVATHLEVEGFPDVQKAQAAELVAAVADGLAGMPVILAGDFNAGPELAQVTDSYADLLAAGYQDPWPVVHPTEPGPTCCFDEQLTSGTLSQRIDLTLYRGDIIPTASERVGLDRTTQSGLYPSDHAGVITTFTAPGDGGCPDEDEDCGCDCEHHHGCDDHQGDDKDCGREHKDCDKEKDCGREHEDCCHKEKDCGREHEDCGLHLGHCKHRDCCDKEKDCGREHEDCGLHLGHCKHRDCCHKEKDCGRQHEDCGLHLGQHRHERCGKGKGA